MFSFVHSARIFTISLGTLALVLLSIAVFKAALLHDNLIIVPCKIEDSDYILDEHGLSKRLAESLKIRTINFGPHNYNTTALREFEAFLTKNFPNIDKSPLISKNWVNNYSLLYFVQGSNPSLKPYLLAGHLDVVPVEEEHWEVPPFNGEIKDGYIWGRGAIDCKHIVLGIFEALEFLLENFYQPQRSFYIAFGHDEESNGLDGAQFISKLLVDQNVKLEYVLDEGSFVLEDLIPGINGPVALIGITEKGSLNLELSAVSVPGHSAAPPKETSIVILAKALSKLEGDIFPSMLGKGPENEMFRELALCASFPLKIIFGNLWLFKPIITWKMENTIMNTLLRTTTAVTMVSGGTKINVLPATATAQVNLRVHPAQTIKEAISFVKQVIDDRIKIKVLSQQPPHPVSPIDTFGYKTIKKTVRQIYNDSCVVPITLMANTDTKWYLNLTSSIYRFSLVRMKPKETKRFHGHNEKIAVDNYEKIVNFYLHIIKSSDQLKADPEHSHADEL